MPFQLPTFPGQVIFPHDQASFSLKIGKLTILVRTKEELRQWKYLLDMLENPARKCNDNYCWKNLMAAVPVGSAPPQSHPPLTLPGKIGIDKWMAELNR